MAIRKIQKNNEGIINHYDIILDEEDTKYFDENKWSVVIDSNTNEIKTLTNKKTKKQFHRELMKVDNKGLVVKFKNSKREDFRKENLIIVNKSFISRKKRNIVFVDVETTGIPEKISYKTQYRKRPYYKYPSPRDKKAYENAKLISLAYMITDETGKTILEPKEFIIKPYKYTIPDSIAQLTGITTDIANKKGIERNLVITKFENDIQKYNVTYFIAHNVDFDKSILMNNALLRNWIEDDLLIHLEKKMNYECTSKLVKKKTGNYKNLEECIKNILNETPVNLHNALSDMIYCKKLYFHLKYK